MTRQDFLAALRDTPRDWTLDHGQLRRGQSCWCPIEAVVLVREPDAHPENADTAAQLLGLSDTDANEIMNAADSTCYVEPLRKQLLEACGL